MAQILQAQLKSKLASAEKIAILGVGSRLKSDDAVGVLAAERVRQLLKPAARGCDVAVFIGGTAPENITGEIKKFRPSHLIIIDAADMGIAPAEIRLIDPGNIGGISFSTHNLPANMLIEYLKQFLKCEVIIIGIQPKSAEFGTEPSEEVKKSAYLLAGLLLKVIG